MPEEKRRIVVVLNQNCTAINHSGLSSTESFLHQDKNRYRRGELDVSIFCEALWFANLASCRCRILGVREAPHLFPETMGILVLSPFCEVGMRIHSSWSLVKQ
jgi:hypothetical protein